MAEHPKENFFGWSSMKFGSTRSIPNLLVQQGMDAVAIADRDGEFDPPHGEFPSCRTNARNRGARSAGAVVPVVAAPRPR